MVNWNALNNMPNPGATFVNAFQQARQNKIAEQQMAEDREIRKEDRERQRAKDDADQQRALLEQHREKILMGAKIVRQINPQDQASWDQARAVAAQAGIDLADIPAQFDPRYVQGLTAIADAFEKQRPTQDPSFIREADMLGIPRDEAARLWRQRQGMIMINGVPHMAAPSTGADDDEWEYEGGPTGNPSGGFR